MTDASQSVAAATKNNSANSIGAMEGIAGSTARNAATMRKVNKLLSVTVDDHLRDLLVYVDDAVPSFLRSSLQDGTQPPPPTAAAPQSDSATVSTNNTATSALSARELRFALEDRVVHMHENFLKAFGALYETYDATAHQVQRLQAKCNALNELLQVRAEEASEFCAAVATLRAERQLLRRRAEAMAEFTKKYNFGAEEQRVLEEGEIDASYLAVLERARAVHRQSQSLLLSREHQQNAAAVMESTYGAIIKATERLAHFLLSSSAGGSTGARVYSTTSSLLAHRGTASSSNSTAMALASLSADVPEVSNFALRCMSILHEENHTQWQRVLDEMARLRRASVLRRYYHLLSTGSAVTLAGSYRGGTQAATEEMAGDEARMGTRPLEASLNDPVYFFSSLFAWLHQTIAEESELFALFVPQDDKAQDSTRQAVPITHDEDEGNRDTETAVYTAQLVTRASLLDLTFSGLCKHIQQALDSVLQRLGRAVGGNGNVASLSLAADSAGNKDMSSNSNSSMSTSSMMLAGQSYASSRRGGGGGAMGPRGLTGGLTRLFVAAKNRTLGITAARAGELRSDGLEASSAAAAVVAGGNKKEKEEEEASSRALEASTSVQDVSIVQRYGQISTRAQQESCVAMTLRGPLYGLRVGFTLMQLFYYYGSATFPPLLGARAALVQLLVRSGACALHEGLTQYAQLLAAHLLDSVVGAVHRVGLLRKLGSAYEVEHQQRRLLLTTGGGQQQQHSSAGRDATLARREPSSSLSGSMLGRAGDAEGTARSASQYTEAGNSTTSHMNASGAKPAARRFVLDFLFAHGGSLLAEDSLAGNAKPGETSTTELRSNEEGSNSSSSNVTGRQASTRAASLAQAPPPPPSSSSLSWTLTRNMSAAPQAPSAVSSHPGRHPQSLSQQQQRAETVELVRVLRQLILPAAPEVGAVLELLHQVLDEGQRQEEMLQALRAQQKQRSAQATSRSSKEEEDEGSEVEATWWQLRPLCLMLCDTLLVQYPAALAKQRILQRSLDDVCQRVMQLNVLVPLGQLVARYEAYMEHTMHMYTTHQTPAQKPLGNAGSSAADEEREEERTLLKKVHARIETLRAALTADLCAAAALHYFPSYSSSNNSSNKDIEQPISSGVSGGADTTRRLRSLFQEMYNVYNMIASQGRLLALPLLESVQDEGVRAIVQQRTTSYLLGELYPRAYDEVRAASAEKGSEGAAAVKLSEEERVTLADMAPSKLRVLMDDSAV